MTNKRENQRQEAIREHLGWLTQSPPRYRPFAAYQMALCQLALGNYPQALAGFGRAVADLCDDSRFWITTGEPNLIVEAYLLSRRDHPAAEIMSRLIDFRNQRGERGLIAQYAMALAGLIWPEFTDSREHANRLLEKRSPKDLRAIGECLIAIHDGRVDADLYAEAVRRYSYVSRQEFRYEARRFVCMPVMAMAAVCPDCVPIAAIESKMLSAEYLSFLRANVS